MKDPLTAAERDRRRQDTDWNAVNLRAPWLKATVLAVIAAATVVIALQVSAMADRVDRLEAEQKGLAVCDHSHPVAIDGNPVPSPSAGGKGPIVWPAFTEFALRDHTHRVTV